MAENRALTYACPSPIRETAPGKVLNSAEGNFGRLIYDRFLCTDAANGKVYRDGDVYVLQIPECRRYADGAHVRVEHWFDGLTKALARVAGTAQLWRDGDVMRVEGITMQALTDALESHSAIPFRPQESEEGVLDTHPATCGLYQVSLASPGDLRLAANPHHASMPSITTVRILHVTEPAELRRRFAAGEIDVMVVGGDERDIYDGTARDLADGTVHSQLSTTISMLSARPGGALADDHVRHSMAAALPRVEFCRKFLGPHGRPSYGFSHGVRDDTSTVPTDVKTRKLPKRITLIVPPSERTVARGHWLARAMADRTGVNVQIRTPTWPDYWAAIHNPREGDLLWTGVHADADETRQWVRYNLFDTWLPLPAHYAPLRSAVWDPWCDERHMAQAERQLVSDGWVMPLYHHYQSYLVRKGLQGFAVDEADWPLPATRRIAGISWA